MQLHGADTPLANDEHEKERLDREASEVLEEVRVALPGVQVLFAFLLALPFQSRWADVSVTQRRVYFAALCLALMSSALMILPSAWHRLNYRRYDKRRLIVLASRCTVWGLALLAIAMSGVLFVIAEELFSQAAAIAAGAIAAAAFAGAWLALPLRDRRRFEQQAD